MSRPALGRLAALAVVPLLGLSVASTAQAAQGDCASGYTCMWENASYGGGVSRHVAQGHSIQDLGKHGFNDTISSAYFDGFRSC